MSANIHTPKVAAFTLIELLVVISIIALLIAILLPAITEVRDHARYIRWKGYSHGLRIDPRLMAYYTFEEGEGDVTKNMATVPEREYFHDPSEFNADITGGTPQWVQGRWKAKSALYFDGFNTRVTAQNAARFVSDEATREVTIIAWAQTQNLAGDNTYAHLGGINNVTMEFHTSGAAGQYHAFNHQGSTFLTAPVLETEWQFIAMTIREGDASNLYTNGELAATQANPSVNSPDYDFRVGYNPIHGWTHLGPIGEVAFFDRALDAGEIKAMYEAGAP